MPKRKTLQPLDPRQCEVCGNTYQPTYHTCKTCGHLCSVKLSQRRNHESREARREESHAATESKRKAAHKSVVTAAQQAALNKAVDSKYAIQLETRVLRPGDPDFDRIAGSVTPLHKITNVAKLEERTFSAEALSRQFSQGA